MSALRFVRKALLIVGAILLVPALLLGLVIGFFMLTSFLYGFSGALRYVPGIALYVFGLCVPLGLFQWLNRSSGNQSGPFRLPGVLWVGGGAIAAAGIGQIMLVTHTADFYWLVFVLAAALPPLTAVALASQRLGGVTTWRRMSAGLLAGSFLGPTIALFLTGLVTVLVVLLILPLRELLAQMIASEPIERLFFSPMLVLGLIETAVVAPIVKELAKPVAVVLLGKRLTRPSEAFLVGMAGGLGFAIVENMLYASSAATEWAHIVALRTIGGALHPLNAGLVALGWYGVIHGLAGARERLIGFYGLAVGFHALWNGGLGILYSGVGSYLLGGQRWEISIYGFSQPGVVVFFMVLEAIALWRTLYLVAGHLAAEGQAVPPPLLAIDLRQPQRLAVWAGALLLIVVPIAALNGPLIAHYWSIAFPIQ
jgi:RsiW-degrading membrane proteinase PrsW (M82 family)